MEYKTGKGSSEMVVYLGMELRWEEHKGGVKFITGMHFRDAGYPIRIRRYPAEGSMVTDSERLGVITGNLFEHKGSVRPSEPSSRRCKESHWRRCAGYTRGGSWTGYGESSSSSGGKPRR